MERVTSDDRADSMSPDSGAHRAGKATGAGRARNPNGDRADSISPDSGARGAAAGNRTKKPAGPSRLPDAGAREPSWLTMAPVPLDMGTGGAVCKNGHALEGAVLLGEEFGGPCPECGAVVITWCARCGLAIGAGADRAEATPACLRCGEAFPWSAEARRTRRAAALRILGAAAAGATIIASLFYVGTFLG